MRDRDVDQLWADFRQKHERWLQATLEIKARIPATEDTPEQATLVQLDHEIGYLKRTAEGAGERDTKIAYERVLKEHRKDIDDLGKWIEQDVVEATRYLQYLDVCRELVDAIAALPKDPEAHLGFPAAVRKNFQYLETISFTIFDCGPTEVEYRSTEMFFKSRLSPTHPYDIAQFGLLRDPTDDNDSPRGNSFILDDVAFMVGLGPEFSYDCYDLGSHSGVAHFVREAAEFLHEHSLPQLKNEPGTIDKLRKAQAEREMVLFGPEP